MRTWCGSFFTTFALGVSWKPLVVAVPTKGIHVQMSLLKGLEAWSLLEPTLAPQKYPKGTSKNDAVGVKLDVSRGLPDRGQA